MKTNVQIVTIPLIKDGWDKDGWDKDDILLCVDMVMSGSDAIGKMSIATFDYPAKNPYHKAQQLLVLTEDTGVKNTDDIMFSANLKDWYTRFIVDCDNTIGDKKVIASYPHIEDTLTLSKKTIQEWINLGTPLKGSIESLYWCKNGDSLSGCEKQRFCNCEEISEPDVDTQGNLIVEFNEYNSDSVIGWSDQDVETAYQDGKLGGEWIDYQLPVKNGGNNTYGDIKLSWQKGRDSIISIPTNTEIEGKAEVYTYETGEYMTYAKDGYIEGYKQALKDLGIIK